MTAPEIGNVGVNPDDFESARPWCAGFVVRELSPVVSNWRASGSLHALLAEHGVAGITGIDTRALTRRIRLSGAQRGASSPARSATPPARSSARAQPPVAGRARSGARGDLRASAYEWDRADAGARPTTAARPPPPPDRAPRRRLRLRHQAQHPAPAALVRLPRHASCRRRRRARDVLALEARRRLPVERPRRSGGGRLRRRGGARAVRDRSCRCSASASATRSSGSRSAARPTSSSSATTAPTTR